MLDNDALRDLQNRFREDFPEFRSFVAAGDRFAARETQYKRQLSREFQSLVERTLETESVDADTFVNELEILLTRPMEGHKHPQNLTNWRDNQTLFKIFEQADRRGQFADLVQRLLSNADERGALAGVIDEFSSWFRSAGIRAGISKVWPTLFLFLWRPEAHIYIKPTFLDCVLDRLAVRRLGHGRYLTGQEYLRVRDAIEEVRNALSEWQPQDMIDVQSFLWAAFNAGIPSEGELVTEDPEKFCVLGTSATYCKRWAEIRRQLHSTGKAAVWWSFGFQNDDVPGPPFWLYLNEGGWRIRGRLRVVEVRTGTAGVHRDCPWPQHVLSLLNDIDDDARDAIRTWFLVDTAEWLDPALGKGDFEPLENLSHAKNLLNQNRFGYARRIGPEEGLRRSELVTAQAVNEILYGPPGTGKTHALNQRREAYVAEPEQVAREVWLQRVVGDLRWREVVAIALLDASANGISVGEMSEHEVVRARAAVSGSGERNLRHRLWSVLQMHADPDCEGVGLSRRNPPFWFWKEKESRWRLVDGWDETDELVRETAKRVSNGPQTEHELVRRYEFVTFHQSYSYEDFVEGIRPVVDEESDGLRYELRHGVFRSLSERARQDPGNRYALFVDEINRGNVSRIFGELITLLEPDKRQGAEQAVSVRLPYSGDEFSVPPNLDVIGTMNTADRSLAHLDAALRRRFQFREVEPDPSRISRNLVVGDEAIDGQALLARMNERIEALYDRDHRIGHSYFLADVDLPRIFERQVLPLLAEYFFEDWTRIRLVLADNLADDEAAQFITVKEFDLGGDLHDIGRQQVFRLNPAALENPEAYRKIYDAPGPDV